MDMHDSKIEQLIVQQVTLKQDLKENFMLCFFSGGTDCGGPGQALIDIIWGMLTSPLPGWAACLYGFIPGCTG